MFQVAISNTLENIEFGFCMCERTQKKSVQYAERPP